MRTAAIVVSLLALGLSACAERLYGGKPFFSPDSAYICGGEREYDVSRFADFRLGATTKAEAVAKLGAPLWWSSSAAGASLLGYDYYRKEPPICQFSNTIPVELEFDPQGLLFDVSYPGAKEKFPRDESRDDLILVQGRLGPGDLYIDGVIPEDGSINFDGFHRMELSVHAVLWGQLREHHFIVTIYTATHLPIGGPDAFVRLRRDKYGIVRARSWWPSYDGLCAKPDELIQLGLDAPAAAAALKRFPCKRDSGD